MSALRGVGVLWLRACSHSVVGYGSLPCGGALVKSITWLLVGDGRVHKPCVDVTSALRVRWWAG
jgi:hypothetical protein